DLKSLADEGKKQVGSGVVAIVGVTGDGKAGLVVGVTSDLTARFNAVDLVKKGAEALGGKGGGGRPDMAQAGGPDGSKARAALRPAAAARGGCPFTLPGGGRVGERSEPGWGGAAWMRTCPPNFTPRLYTPRVPRSALR